MLYYIIVSETVRQIVNNQENAETTKNAKMSHEAKYGKFT